MNIKYKTTKDEINWQEVADILERAGLSHLTADKQEFVFKNSFAVVFVYDDERIVGVGRAISDGLCHANIYNVALDEEYHGSGIGRKLIELLLEQLKGQNVILYTHPRTVALYEKFGFRRNKTAMCHFEMDPEEVVFMEEEGFFLPEGFRFVDEYDRPDMEWTRK